MAVFNHCLIGDSTMQSDRSFRRHNLVRKHQSQRALIPSLQKAPLPDILLLRNIRVNAVAIHRIYDVSTILLLLPVQTQDPGTIEHQV